VDQKTHTTHHTTPKIFPEGEQHEKTINHPKTSPHTHASTTPNIIPAPQTNKHTSPVRFIAPE